MRNRLPSHLFLAVVTARRSCSALFLLCCSPGATERNLNCRSFGWSFFASSLTGSLGADLKTILLLWSSVGPWSGDFGLSVLRLGPVGSVLPRARAARLSSSSSWWTCSALAIICSAILTEPLSCLVRVERADRLPLLFFFLGDIVPKNFLERGLPRPDSGAVLPATSKAMRG